MSGRSASVDQWQAVSSDRSRDAVQLWDGGRTLAATYLKWYTVECLAKALIAAAGRKPPTSGQLGHDIGALLDRAGLRRSDISPDLRAHYERRSVAMRYELESSRDFSDEYQAATVLATRLDARVRRASMTPRHNGRNRG